MTGAVLRAQWLSMRPGRKGTGRRGAVFSLVTAAIWYGFWCVAAALAYQRCAATAESELPAEVRAGLFLIFLYWQSAPLVTAGLGAGLDMRKLLIYPIPRGRLFEMETLLRLLSGAEMLLVLAGGAAGLAANPHFGGWAAAPRLAMGALLFAGFNVLAASGTRSLAERLLARRRVRELAVLLAVGALLVPRFLAETETRLEWIATLVKERQDGLPWTLAANLLSGRHAFPALFGLCAWTALAALFGRWQFERGLRYDPEAAGAVSRRPGEPRAGRWAERFYRFPGRLWSDPLAAIVEKELRSLGRSPRFRMVFVMGFSFGLLVWLPLVIGRRAEAGTALERHFLTVVSVYALTLLGQVSYWNSFGFDRSAAQIYFFAPLEMRKVMAGKNLAALVYIYLEAVVVAAVTLAFGVRLGWGQLAETGVVLGISSLYMLALGNISSVEYPRGISPERVSQGGASSRFQALIFLLFPLALLPVFLAYAARYLLSSEAVFWAAMAGAGTIGAALYWIAMESAATTAVRRREEIVRELSRGEGPVAGN